MASHIVVANPMQYVGWRKLNHNSQRACTKLTPVLRTLTNFSSIDLLTVPRAFLLTASL